MLLKERLVFPLQSPLFDNVNEPTQKEAYKERDRPKTIPSQAFKIDGIGIEKDHFDIE
jgi:hypothetical protein